MITGEGQFIGNTLCDKKNCDQCKPFRKEGQFAFVFKPNLLFQRKLNEHQDYLKKYCVVVDGDIAIGKRLVAELVIAKTTLEETKKVRYEEYDRLESSQLKKDYVEALDEWEMAQDRLFQQFQVLRKIDYPVGSKEWKSKLEAESVLDIISSQANYDQEIQDLITDAKNTGITTAMASDKIFRMVQRGMEMEARDGSVMNQLANKIQRKKPRKPTKKTIQIGKFNVPKHLIEDYKNSVQQASSSAMLFKSRYGSLDPAVELKRFQGRVDLHKQIFKELALPYHQDIDYQKKKLSKKEKQSRDLQDAISEYLEK